jgi:hypothetical protein
MSILSKLDYISMIVSDEDRKAPVILSRNGENLNYKKSPQLGQQQPLLQLRLRRAVEDELSSLHHCR